jgi:hypothetical protein
MARPNPLFMPNVACCPAEPFWLHRALPALSRRQTPVRVQLDSRDQARRLSPDGAPRSGRNPLAERRGNDWADKFPLVVETVNHLKIRSCLIDGEVVCCDERGRV